MNAGGVRAICFDLDNTLWEIEPVLLRAERILADWLRTRYPRVTERFTAAEMLRAREALSLAQPHRAHDFTYLRREVMARLAAEAGYDTQTARSLADEAFAIWHAARNQCTPYEDVVPALEILNSRFRLATLSNGNADLGCIGLAHHFEVRLHAAELGFAKPDPRAYSALADALTLQPSEILFVGDEPHADVIGPRSVGLRTVWVNRRSAAWPEGLDTADASVADLSELVSLLVPP